MSKKTRRDVKGPYALICNHACSIDVICLFGATRERMTVVIGKCSYDTLPVPLALTLALQFAFNLGYTVLIPVSAVVAILFAYWLYKKDKLR